MAEKEQQQAGNLGWMAGRVPEPAVTVKGAKLDALFTRCWMDLSRAATSVETPARAVHGANAVGK